MFLKNVLVDGRFKAVEDEEFNAFLGPHVPDDVDCDLVVPRLYVLRKV